MTALLLISEPNEETTSTVVDDLSARSTDVEA